MLESGLCPSCNEYIGTESRSSCPNCGDDFGSSDGYDSDDDDLDDDDDDDDLDDDDSGDDDDL